MLYFVIVNLKFLIVILFFSIPPNCLSVNIHYENILTLFGRKGYFCTTVEQVSTAVRNAFMVNIFHLFFNNIS